MAHPFSIRELLTGGADPTAEDSQNLESLGAFIARFYAQHLNGIHVPASMGQVGLETTNSRGGLSASTAARWTEPMGLGLDMLGSGMGGFWQVAQFGARAGYAAYLDAVGFPEQVIVIDEEGEIVFEEAPISSRGRRTRRPSLFGPRKHGSKTQARARKQALQWPQGGSIAVSAVQALADGGLRLVDQISHDAPPSERSASVDGLWTDTRTPALTSALHGVGQSFERGAILDSMLGTSDSREALRADSRLGANRPIYSFFDAVEGDFLTLLPEVAAEVLRPSSPELAAQERFIPATRTQQFQAPSRGESPAHPRRAQARSQHVQTSLEHIVQAPDASGSTRVLPLTHGVFTSPSALAPTIVQGSGIGAGPRPRAARRSMSAMSPIRLAQHVVRDRQGGARARIQRSALGAPRVALTHLQTMLRGDDSPTATTWRLAADGGRDLPLGASLGASEIFAANVLASHPVLAPSEARTIAAASPTFHGYHSSVDTIDGVSWIVMPASEDGDVNALGLSLVPEGRPATMVPAATAHRLNMATTAQRLTMAAAAQGRSTAPMASAPAALGSTRALPLVTRPQQYQGRMQQAAPGQEPHSLVGASIISSLERRQMAPLTPMSVAGPATMGGIGSETADAFVQAPSTGLVGAFEKLAASGRLDTFFSRGYAGIEEIREIVRLEAGPEAALEVAELGAPVATQATQFGSPRSSRAERAQSPAAAALRRVLNRPVATARERIAVSTQMTSALGNFAEYAPLLANALMDSATPATSSGAARWLASPHVVQEITRLSPAKRREIAKGFVDAGWSRTELQMLSLEAPERIASDESSQLIGSTGSAASPLAAALTSAAPLLTPAASPALPATAAASAQQAATGRIMRNLARVITGTEALTGALRKTLGSRDDKSPGAIMTPATAASLSTFLPLLQTRPDTYFGSLAPQQRVGYTRFTDVLTELVAIAEDELAHTDRPATPEERVGLSRQLERVSSFAEKVAVSTPGTEERRQLTDIGTFETVDTGDRQGLPLVARPEVFEREGAALRETPSIAGPTPVGYQRSFGEPMPMVQPLLEVRLAAALDSASHGPAGLERLVTRRRERPVRRRTSAGQPFDRSTIALSPAAETGLATSIDVERGVELSSVLAPEVMLHGVTGVRTGVASDYREIPGALASLTDIPADFEGVMPSSTASPQRDTRAQAVQRASGLSLRPQATRGGLGQDAVARLMKMVDLAGGRRDKAAGLTPRIVGSLLSRLGERQNASIMSAADSGDFALAWLSRIDGKLTGLDTGVEQSREQIASFFGLEPRTSMVAIDSPVLDAEFVAPKAVQRSEESDDRSGLREVGSQVGPREGSGGRAAAAASKIDWGFVNTGSSSSTSHVDMGALSSAAFGAAEAQKASMPLVAPAMKAVAQTALRSSRGEAAPASEPPAAAAPAAGGGQGMHDGAMDKLAMEMAGRIAKRMQRERDRRGTWA